VSGEVPASPESAPAAPGESVLPMGASAVVPGQLAAGSQIAGYRLMEQIGRGGMAVVYRAIDLRLDRPVALKILAPELARDEAFRHRFIRECRAAAAVDHPCIIPVFDAGEASGVLFIAMRYVSGRDVRTLLDREGSLPADRVVNIIEQVASALDAAHARGLVHRDVKPANMLLDSSASSGQLDHVYLSDFGLTKQSQLTSSLTSTGQFLGTLDYIAPEQIEGSKLVDGRADLYSLACAAFEMLSDAPPFRRDQGVAVIWAQISAPPPRLTDLRPDLPATIDSVLARALAKAPSDRYQTCLEFAAALRGATELAADPAASGAGSNRPTTQPALWAGMADDWPDRSAAAAFAAEPPTRASNLTPARGASPDSGYPAAYASSGPRYSPPSQPYAPPSQPYAPAGQPYAPAGQLQAGQPPAGQPYRRGPSRRRPWWRTRAALIVGCLAVLCLAAGTIAVLRSGAFRSSTGPLTSASSALRTGGPTGSAGTATHVRRGPSGTVRAYFAALNAHNYVKAWDLGGRNTGSSYVGYVNGFGTTAKDTVTIVSVSGSVVTARITAVQTDGTVKTYQGTYTVNKGVITQFNVRQVG
jgi:serine/threonine protein kinase